MPKPTLERRAPMMSGLLFLVVSAMTTTTTSAGRNNLKVPTTSHVPSPEFDSLRLVVVGCHCIRTALTSVVLPQCARRPNTSTTTCARLALAASSATARRPRCARRPGTLTTTCARPALAAPPATARRPLPSLQQRAGGNCCQVSSCLFCYTIFFRQLRVTHAPHCIA